MPLSVTVDDSFNSLLPDGAPLEDIENSEEVIQPDLTYKIDLKAKSIRGKIDGKEGVTQAIHKRLMTDTSVYEIYSDNYGLMVNDLIGLPSVVIQSELQRRIIESVMEDDRVLSVTDFKASSNREELTVVFTVNTSYGSFSAARVYEIL